MIPNDQGAQACPLIAGHLESRRGEIAAKAKISGPVHAPRISSWQIVGELVKNAFFRTILPEFGSQASRPRRK